MWLCNKEKRIILNHKTISELGNPSRISLWYDDDRKRLMLTPANKNELDSYEIPPYFWKYPNHSCVISQIGLFEALLLRIKLEDGSKYSYLGICIETKKLHAVVFDLSDGKRLR
jgi:hypothetical protein